MSTPMTATSPRPFAVYYGWPSDVNGAGGDVAAAIAAFAPYRVVIFGDDTVTPAGDPKAPAILAGVAARGGQPYGYVSIGVTHGEPTTPSPSCTPGSTPGIAWARAASCSTAPARTTA